MANEQNLVQNRESTPSERRERAKKAGLASGKARKTKQQIRMIAQAVFDGRTFKDEDGEELTAEEILAQKIMKVAMNTSHPRWLEVVKLLIVLTDSDISESELELRELETQSNIESINSVPKINLDSLF